MQWLLHGWSETEIRLTGCPLLNGAAYFEYMESNNNFQA